MNSTAWTAWIRYLDKTKIMRFILYADDKNEITLSNFFDYIEFSI